MNLLSKGTPAAESVCIRCCWYNWEFSKFIPMSNAILINEYVY